MRILQRTQRTFLFGTGARSLQGLRNLGTDSVHSYYPMLTCNIFDVFLSC